MLKNILICWKQESSSLHNIANSFNQICKFYNDFVNNNHGNQATDEDYKKLVKSIKYSDKDNLDKGYQFSKNQVYVELTLYYQFENLLNDYRTSFAKNGIDKSTVIEIFDSINNNAQKIDASSDINEKLQQKVLKAYKDYTKNIERAYENVANSAGREQ